MIKRYKRIGLVLAVLAALLLSGTVFAEGGQTPEAGEPGDAPAAETAAPPEGTGGTEVLPEDAGQTGEPAGEPAETDEPAEVVGESEAPAEEPGETEEPAEGAGETEEPQEQAQETGEGAADEVKVVDASGEELGAEAAAGAGDPRWQVGKQWYSSVTAEPLCYAGTSVADGTCFVSTTPFQTAFDEIDSNPAISPTKGLIYVDYGTYTENITINGSTTPNLAGLRGLIGVPDGGLSPTINGSISISNLAGGFTLSGFTINGGLSVQQSAGNLALSDLLVSNPNGHGIEIGENSRDDAHLGNVTLANVDSSVNNGAGARVYAYGNVKITASSFNDNNRFDMTNDDPLESLHVITFGKKLDMNGVTANNNFGSGIVTLTGKTTIRNVIAKSNTVAGYPGSIISGYGLFLQAGSGSILVENAVTDLNENSGIYVEVWGKTPVTLKNVGANGNGIGIEVKSEGNVTVSNSLTDINFGDGLRIHTAGAVRLSSIRASSNVMGSGLVVEGAEIYSYIKNSTPDSLGWWTSPASVTLGSPNNIALANHFAENGQAGIRVVSERPVTLSNFSALDNVGVGVQVDASRWIDSVYTELPAGAVTIRATIRGVSNLVSGNDLGMDIWAAGNVTLDRTRIVGNAGAGAEIVTAAMARLTNLEASYNQGMGLDITADGNAVLANLLVVDNNDGGVWVYALGNVTVGGTNVLTGNEYKGLEIETLGAVKVSNLDASRNGLSGIVIFAFSPGRAVALSNVSALDNQVYGISVEADGNVTLSGSSIATYNGFSGLWIETSGAVSVTNFQAASNGAGGSGESGRSGIYIQSTGEKASVTLRGVNTLYNATHGLYVDSVGRVTLSGVNAWLNYGNGARLESSVGGISLLNSTFMSNGIYGVYYQGVILQNKNNIFLDNQSDLVGF